MKEVLVGLCERRWRSTLAVESEFAWEIDSNSLPFSSVDTLFHNLFLALESRPKMELLILLARFDKRLTNERKAEGAFGRQYTEKQKTLILFSLKIVPAISLHEPQS